MIDHAPNTEKRRAERLQMRQNDHFICTTRAEEVASAAIDLCTALNEADVRVLPREIRDLASLEMLREQCRPVHSHRHEGIARNVWIFCDDVRRAIDAGMSYGLDLWALNALEMLRELTWRIRMADRGEEAL